MSRHGYSDDVCDDPRALGRWRGRVASALRGKRGQKLLCEMRDALDAMPEKRLIAGSLVCEDGVCALGAVAVARNLDVSHLDPEDCEKVAAALNVAEPLVREIAYENDDYWNYPGKTTPEARWKYMRKWVERRLEKHETQPCGA